MTLFAKIYYTIQKYWKAFKIYLIIAGPGLVVMVADNDAGGITTYAATGAKYGYHLIWFLLLLIPSRYVNSCIVGLAIVNIGDKNRSIA